MKLLAPNRINFLDLDEVAETGKAITVWVDLAGSASWLDPQSFGNYNGQWSSGDYTFSRLLVWSVEADGTGRTLIDAMPVVDPTGKLQITAPAFNQESPRRLLLSAEYSDNNNPGDLYELPLDASSYLANYNGLGTLATTLTMYGDSDQTHPDRKFFKAVGSGADSGKEYTFFNGIALTMPAAKGGVVVAPQAAALHENPADSGSLSVVQSNFDRKVHIAEKKADPLILVKSSVFLNLSAPLNEGDVLNIDTNNLELPSGGISVSYNTNTPNDMIHIAPLGYHPDYMKTAWVHGYAGDGGEINISGINSFSLIRVSDGAEVYTGSLVWRKDQHWGNSSWYQQVKEANFSDFNTPGHYYIKVAWLGISDPFFIDEGVYWACARFISRGLYNMRCGQKLELPWTRNTHEACHLEHEIPVPAENYPVVWGQFNDAKATHQTQSSPKTESDLIFPYQRSGAVELDGGYHDAGDYGRYATNIGGSLWWHGMSASILKGDTLDNLGIPESGDGKSDILGLAVWDADSALKLQEPDGGFYSVIRPATRLYEDNVSLQEGDTGDMMTAFPKDLVSTHIIGAGLAKLGRCAALRVQYGDEKPDAYIAAAVRAYDFTINAFNTYGRAGSIQAIRGGWDHAADDTWASLCIELYLATGDAKYHNELLTRDTLTTGAPYDPANNALVKWGWNRDSKDPSYWVVASYAFADVEYPGLTLDADFLAKSKAAVQSWGEMLLESVEGSSFGEGLPWHYKVNNDGLWIFSPAEAVGMPVLYELTDDAELKERLLNAYILCWNHITGCNANNQSFIGGVGLKQLYETVSQYRESNLEWKTAPTGIFMADCAKQWWQSNLPSKNSVRDQFHPASDQRPFHERFVDSFYAGAELIVSQKVEAVAGGVWLAVTTNPSRVSQVYTGILGSIEGLNQYPENGVPIRMRLHSNEVSEADLENARVYWESTYGMPDIGGKYNFYRKGNYHTMTPEGGGEKEVIAEAHLVDGRIVLAKSSYIYAQIPGRQLAQFLDLSDPTIIAYWNWQGDSLTDMVGGLEFTLSGDAVIDNESWSGVPAVKFSHLDTSLLSATLAQEVFKEEHTTEFIIDMMVHPIWNGSRDAINVVKWESAWNSLFRVTDGYYWHAGTSGLPYSFTDLTNVSPSNQWSHWKIRIYSGGAAMSVNGGVEVAMTTSIFDNLQSSVDFTFKGLGGWVGPLTIRKI